MRKFLLCLLLLSSSLVAQENWDRFRGPNGSGISNAKSIPVKFSDNNFIWKTKLPGKGYSSPVVWGKTVYVTSAETEKGKGYLYAVDQSNGKVKWVKEFQIIPYVMHPDNHAASSTPAVDSAGVYSLWYNSDKIILTAISHTGNIIWQREFEEPRTQFGLTGSPIVFKDVIFFTREGDRGYADGSWVAVENKSGKTLWEIKTGYINKCSYSVPCIYNSDIVITSQSHGLCGVDYKTGQIKWELKGVLNDRIVSSPCISGNILTASCKYKMITAQLPVKDKQAKILQEFPTSIWPYVPTSILVSGLLFVALDNGYIVCADPSTGEVFWKEKPAGLYYSSPVCVDGKLYCISKKGEVAIVEAAKSYKLLAVNNLNEDCFATPAVANGLMVFRTFSHLIAIGKIDN